MECIYSKHSYSNILLLVTYQSAVSSPSSRSKRVLGMIQDDARELEDRNDRFFHRMNLIDEILKAKKYPPCWFWPERKTEIKIYSITVMRLLWFCCWEIEDTNFVFLALVLATR